VVPATVDADGLSRFLRGRTEGEEFGRVLDALAHEIWLARDRRGFLQDICEQHAAVLAGVLRQIRPSADQIERAIGQTIVANGHGHGAHQTVAADVLASMRGHEALRRDGLTEEVALFLLELLFLHLLGGPRLLIALRPVLAAYVAAAAGQASPASANALAPVVPGPRPVLREVARPQPVAVAQADWTAAASGIAARYKLAEGAQRRFLTILSAQNLSPEQRLERFEEMARWLEATIAELMKPSNQGPQIARLKQTAAAALAGGDFEGAFDLLKQVSRTLREGRRQTEARLAEEIESLRHQMADEAASTASLAELALARFDYDAAAELFAEAAAGVPKSDAAAEIGYLLRRAETLYRKGEEKDDKAALAAAADAYRDALALFPRGHESETWVQAKINLANALGATAVTGAAGQARLSDAVEAYGHALSAIDPGKAPMRWALTQLSAGAAMIRLGEIGDRDRHWRAAAAALVPALEVFERQGSTVYAEFARMTLRQLHDQIEGQPRPALGQPSPRWA
jgi:hypothetical protein